MKGTALLFEEYRGELLDLTHYGYITIVDEKGKVIYSAGDSNAMVFYRSASKPIQCLPVIARDIDKKYGITEKESAIFAGSHMGEKFHVETLKSIFKKADLKYDDLIMKPATPSAAYANEERIKEGLPKSKFYHNCSGKHAALMLTQRELGGDIKDYWKIDSVGQQEVLRTMSVFSEFPEEKVIIGIDGCGVPVFAYPMKNIAIAFKNLACIDTIKDDILMEAAHKFVPRMNKAPEMIRGTGSRCTVLNADPNIIAKSGANGVYCIGLKKERIGIAFKTVDGNMDLIPSLVREIFNQIGYVNSEIDKKLEEIHSNTVINDNGTPVGSFKPVFKFEKHL